jgi:programmed cell death 6-interacting protein
LSSGLYERLCVLFNIAAQASDIASTQQFDTDDGLKTAMKLYQLAASAFSFIRDNSLTTTRSDCTTDFYHETLTCLISMMLAHAQEVFYHKAVNDKLKESTVSKLAMQCSDFYADALKNLQHEDLRDLQKAWLSTVAGKQALFHALAEFHKAKQDETDQNVGDALARLTKSVELLKVADSRGGKEMNTKNYAATVQGSLDKAKRENDHVYHARVPDYKQLAQLERAALAKVSPVKCPLSEDFRGTSVSFHTFTSCFHYCPLLESNYKVAQKV